ncbi:MAG: hypothetical protein KDA24_06045 [Deltaproteobacteria bacterium]|nr:hypothetical protein [Deltaproteobacteria bacterium]
MRSLTLLALAASLALSPVAFAGDEDDKHENYFKTDDNLDLGDLVVEAGNVNAQEDVVVFKAKMKNATSDWIFVKKHEIEFDVGGQTMKPFDGKEKPSIVIDPEGKKSLSLKLKGSGLHVDEITVDFKGVYKASSSGETLAGPEFVLPPAKNKAELGPFKCSVTAHDQATKVTKTSWECQYTGDGIGYIDASGISVKIQTGDEFASTFRKNKPAMLKHNEKAKFTTTFEIEKRIVDMQFATLELHWGDTFSEAKLESVDSDTWDFELDEELTAEKND